jgi:UDP-N-acetylglucosamine diphosphorylase/glucosamine-1-phosphate N-acetyltransferase
LLCHGRLVYSSIAKIQEGGQMGTICIFEDKGYTRLLPLVYMRPVYGLRCGIGTILEKILRKYDGAKIELFCRDYLAEFFREQTKYSVNEAIKDDCLFINGRIIMDKVIAVKGGEEIGVKDDVVLYARLNKERSSQITPESILTGGIWDKLKKEIKLVKVDSTTVNNTWDLVNYNPEQIVSDFKEIVKSPEIKGEVYEGAYLVNKPQIHIGKGSKIKPGAVLDAEGGPIYIGENVEVLPNAVIEGPTAIGNKSIIRIGAKIREGTTMGEVCRVGGEVEESIIHGYSNKQHDGFLGHGYLSMWCNLGADTNNSDLKNNYGNVKVYVEGKLIDSGSRFVGLTMGDHSKSSIGTMFNTGTVVGLSSNIYGVGLPPKLVPSFSWGGASKLVAYDLEKALATAKTVMGRRKVQMSAIEEKLLRKVYELTREERKTFIK